MYAYKRKKILTGEGTDKYNAYGSTYTYQAGTNMTLTTFESNIANSLTSWKSVILHAKTEGLTYYNNHVSGHYLSLDYINRTTDSVRIVDCNYSNSYYGTHWVTLGEAYNAVTCESGRYLIY